jgi:hypothetical protein
VEAPASAEISTREDPSASPAPSIVYTLGAAVPSNPGWVIDWGNGVTERVVAWLFFYDSNDAWYVYPSTSKTVVGPNSPPFTLVPPP